MTIKKRDGRIVDFDETKIILDENGEVEDIKPDLKYNDDLFIPQLEEKAIIVNKYIIM